MPYATGLDLLTFFDANLVGRLVDDNYADLSNADIASHQVVLSALEAASGRFEAALQFGKRYSVTDLLMLTTNSRNYLTSIVCKLAMVYIMGRRPGNHEREREFLKNEIDIFLDALSNGKEVFTLSPQLDAGLASVSDNRDIESGVITQRSPMADRLKGKLFAQY